MESLNTAFTTEIKVISYLKSLHHHLKEFPYFPYIIEHKYSETVSGYLFTFT